MNSFFRPRAAAAALGAAVVAAGFLVAGCGSSGSSNAGGSPSATASVETAPAPVTSSASASTTPTPAPTAATSPSDLASLAPPAASGDPAAVALYERAATSLASVSSVHVNGAIAEGGTSIKLDITFAAGKGATGSIGLGGGTMQLLAVGDSTYFKFDRPGLEAFASVGGASEDISPGVESLIVGKWLKVASGDSEFGDFSEFTDLPTFVQSMVAPSGSLSLRSGTTTVDGQQVTTIVDSDGGGLMYVQATGANLPVEITSSDGSAGDSSGQLTFTDYNKPVTITAPSDAVDLGALEQLGQSPPAS